MKKLRPEELGRMDVDSYRRSEKLPVCILLDNVRSLHNVGSAFRSADAFRIEKLYLTGITGIPPHREINKTALGATESVEWEYVVEPGYAVTWLKNNGYKILIIEQTTESLLLDRFVPQPDQSYCIVFGNEVNGVSEQVLAEADEALAIPQSGTKHSLNVSVCVGIVAWEFYRKLSQLIV